ncbi:PREDICTED: uncharacterized protein LOC106100003 [Papilio polytes]|uniref:uncharacterized protein LOC106100003 n=1 Tax=Papilio polytes TaxID=76194 RepID=UPI00067645F9|nr:PREDICTED: uncharacterized protein LOC106100003 [Papilio polytes]
MTTKQNDEDEMECKRAVRHKPDMTVTEEIARAIGNNYRTVPAFEKGLFDYVLTKHYSLERNQYLQCRWLEYKRGYEKRVFAPFQFPSHRDLHFHNGAVRFRPAESIHRRTDHRMQLQPGPGVDRYGQMPIPYELFMKRGEDKKERKERKNIHKTEKKTEK